MKLVDIPNYGVLEIKNILLDMNGTIQNNGRISKLVKQKIIKLNEEFDVYIISADTRGNLSQVAKELTVKYAKIQSEYQSEAKQKEDELVKLGKEHTVAIGNGNNDELMLKSAILGIGIVGKEGATTKTLSKSDLIFHDIIDALDFLLDDKKIIATLRS